MTIINKHGVRFTEHCNVLTCNYQYKWWMVVAGIIGALSSIGLVWGIYYLWAFTQGRNDGRYL